MTTTSPASQTLIGLPGPGLRRALWERYVTLLAGGTPSDRVLVLLDGSARGAWRAWLRGAVEGGEVSPPPRVMGGQLDHTPSSFIQQELRLWWGLALEGLATLGAPGCMAHEPEFAAIDLAQYLMGLFMAHRRHDPALLEAPAAARFLGRAHSAPHFQHVQLLDALARGVEHGFSLAGPPDGVERRILDRDGQPVAEACVRLATAICERLRDGGAAPDLMVDAAEAIALYVDGMLRAGVLDHALQLDVYASALWPHPDYQASLRQRFDHVLVDRLDELPARWQALLRTLVASDWAGCFTLQRDPDADPGFGGGLREYVGADPTGAWRLATALTQVVPAAPDPAPAPFSPLGRALWTALTLPDGASARPRPVALPAGSVELHLGAYSPAEMLQDAADRVVRLLQTGAAEPRHIALVSPTLSPLLIWSLRQKLGSLAPLYVFAGTNRLRDYRPVRTLITLAKLAHPHWNLPPTRYELLELLELTTGLNPLKLGRLATRLFPDGRLAEPSLVHMSAPELGPEALKRYALLGQWVARQAAPQDLPAFFQDAFTHIYTLARAPRTHDPSADEVFMREISQIGQLIELTERFEAVDRRVNAASAHHWALRFLAFLDDSPIAERPFFQREPHRDAVMLSTPSQLAERGFSGADEELRCLFLLDIGSTGWWKPDRRELTNARVLSQRWPGGAYTLEQELRDQNEKLARVLLACCLKARERMFVYGCLTDEEGHENQGELPYLLGNLLGASPAGAREDLS